MHKTSNAIRRGILYISALVLVAGYPTAVMATTQEPVTDAVPVVTTTEPVQEAPVQEEEAPELTYTYDPATEKWNSEEWWFNPDSGTYEKPPTPIIIEPEITDKDEQSTDKTVDTTVEIDNTVKSDATSGDALLSGNSTAGSALTGDATAVANIINSVNSSVSTSGNQKITTFTKDIMGDVKGDIVLYPLLLKAMLEAEANKDSATAINANTNFDVNNDVTVNAATGNATVDGNTTAGDATTGNATAMANVVNILNSMIAAQESFIGTINIYGSLDGDILIAPDFIPQLMADNSDSSGSNTKISSQDTTTIVNNISAVAQSGAASVFNNTTGGNATTGSADSNVVIFNVTGHEIVAENSMLIFVNVLGKWVGLILDAPAGASAAMYGSGVTKNEQYAPDLTVEAQSEHGITNNISLTAQTGDAAVSNNTKGGNATSGNAKAMANVANFSGSQVNLTGWFRLLFINVMGDCRCSVKVAQFPYGNMLAEPAPAPTAPIQFIPEEDKPEQSAGTNTGILYTLIDSRSMQSTDNATVAVNTDTHSEVTEPTAEVKGAMSNETASEERVQSEPQNLRSLIGVSVLVLVGASIVGIRRII